MNDYIAEVTWNGQDWTVPPVPSGNYFITMEQAQMKLEAWKKRHVGSGADYRIRRVEQ